VCEALRQHHKVSAAQARERAVYLLEAGGGSQNAAERLGTVSASVVRRFCAQRVMIAMALMCEPDPDHRR